MSTESNGEQYIKYTTKELLREIALKVDRIEDRFDGALSKTDEEIRDLENRLLRIETSRDAVFPEYRALVKKVESHAVQLNEISGGSKWKQWALPVILTIISIVVAGISLWVSSHTGTNVGIHVGL